MRGPLRAVPLGAMLERRRQQLPLAAVVSLQLLQDIKRHKLRPNVLVQQPADDDPLQRGFSAGMLGEPGHARGKMVTPSRFVALAVSLSITIAGWTRRQQHRRRPHGGSWLVVQRQRADRRVEQSSLRRLVRELGATGSGDGPHKADSSAR